MSEDVAVQDGAPLSEGSEAADMAAAVDTGPSDVEVSTDGQDAAHWEAEARKARKEAKALRDRAKAAEERYENARKVFPQIDEMTPEQLVSRFEEERARADAAEAANRDLQIDLLLKEAVDEAGANYRLTAALLKEEGSLANVDLQDREAATLELRELVSDVVAREPQLAGKPGVSPVSGTGVTPGVSSPVSSEGQWEDLMKRGDYRAAEKLITGKEIKY